MVKRGNQIIRNYMTLNYEFTGIRIFDGYLTPVDWELKINLVIPDKKNKSKEELETKATFAFQKIYFWLDTNLPDVIIVDVEKDDDLYIANLSANIMMYCPGNSGDDMVVRLIHSKLSSLVKNDILVGEIQLKGSDSSIDYTFDCIDGDYSLPDKTTDYYSEGVARDEHPWWTRDDGFCFEFIKPTDSDLSDEEIFKDIVDPMDEFYRFLAETDKPVALKEPARIVQVEKWKPKTVE
jgi:hypothetical protein